METNASNIPKFLIAAGLLLILFGILAWALQGRLNWVGRLPGDIRIERDQFNFYFPITTMILFSLILIGLLRLARWLWP